MTRERILIIRLSALGDVLNTLAFVNRLRQARPHAHITWVLQPLTYDLVKHQKNVDRFVVFSRKGGLDAFRKIWKELGSEPYDLVFMLQVSLKASMISLGARGRVKLGFDIRRSRELQWLFSNRRISHRPAGHVLDQFLEFLDDRGMPDTPLDWNIHITEEERAYQKRFFQAIGRPVVSFVIASSKPDKDWHAEGFARVMDAVDGLNLHPLIVGGPSQGEKALADKILGLCRCAPRVALEKPIRHTLLQLDGSRVVVGPDTGPMHMAVALNVPTVALYGYSDPRRCGPYSRFQDLLINKYHLPGEKKGRITRKTKPGRMNLITPEEVISKIEYALQTYGC